MRFSVLLPKLELGPKINKNHSCMFANWFIIDDHLIFKATYMWHKEKIETFILRQKNAKEVFHINQSLRLKKPCKTKVTKITVVIKFRMWKN